MNARAFRIARTALTGALASLAFAAPAMAACKTPVTSRPFTAWGDDNDYFLGSDFESTTGWTLSGGARLQSGSEPFKATGKLGKSSLALPTGAVAVSPPVCLTKAYPTARFFAKAVEGNAASLRVEALASTPYTQVVGVGAVNGTTAWSLTPILQSGVQNLQVGADGTVTVRFRVTADYGTWSVDDLFVDPRKLG